jgi:hypothetical protein
MTRRPPRVPHTADLHVDGDGDGAHGHCERERLVFQRIVDRVLADCVDLPLIAGPVVWGLGLAEHEVAFRPLAHIPARHPRRCSLAMGHRSRPPRTG